jgi:hypothetical protein
MDWVKFESGKPVDKAMVVYFVAPSSYVFGVGDEYESIKIEYPTASHWCLFLMPPGN